MKSTAPNDSPRTTAARKSDKETAMRMQALEETNEALKTLLARGEDDKKLVEDRIKSNVKELVLPYVDKLKLTGLTVEQQTYLEIIETTIKNVFSSFLQKITSKQYHFTPKEIQVATLIREGRRRSRSPIS